MGTILHLPPTNRLRKERTVRVAADPIARPRALDAHRDPLNLLRSLFITFVGEVLLLGGGTLALCHVFRRQSEAEPAAESSAESPTELPALLPGVATPEAEELPR